MKKRSFSARLAFLFLATSTCPLFGQTYKIVDTGVYEFSGNSAVIVAPAAGADFYGQDATYSGNQPTYTDNGNGTITDNVTGLMWQKDMGTKITYSAAFAKAETMTLGGYSRGDLERIQHAEWPVFLYVDGR